MKFLRMNISLNLLKSTTNTSIVWGDIIPDMFSFAFLASFRNLRICVESSMGNETPCASSNDRVKSLTIAVSKSSPPKIE